MTDLIATSVVHFYDTRTRGILCGIRGADHRSTKHARGVTCHACIGLLQERRTVDAEVARAASNEAN